jgi:hypothetical protein
MIVSTFDIQGKGNLLISCWLFNSATFNHMTSSMNALHNIHKYEAQ